MVLSNYLERNGQHALAQSAMRLRALSRQNDRC